ncbi:MAG: DUF1028 domain-containing protein [Ignavibacteriae bacterium]|nr:MAG: DUF1028 domain-containing protein [Ignavibacteriota bacterium]
MKKLLLAIFILFIIFNFTYKPSVADTFSIAAIDIAANQVGSAGASCYNSSPGCIILSDVHPGVGVIHTQASWLAGNQNYARSLMNLGLSPQQIIDSLIAHDAQNNPAPRQYGIIDMINGGRVAAYTGSGCTPWAGHWTGPTYSIQGNILLGQKVIDSMKSKFLNTTGILAVRLMAALQGAKMVGADTRCAQYGTSSSSAFLRVAKNTDPQSGPYWCDINVRLTNPLQYGKDPIDSLQTLFNIWLTTVGLTGFSNNVPEEFMLYQNYPNPFNPLTMIKFDLAKASNVKLVIYDMVGNEVAVLVDNLSFPAGNYEYAFDANNLSSGVYIYKLISDNFSDSKKMTLLK